MESMEEIQSWIKRGVILTCVLIAVCLLFVLYNPFFLVDIAVMAVCAYYIWTQYSRAAATVQFGWQCIGLPFVITMPVAFIIKSLIIYVFYKTMRATYAYHSITNVEAEFMEDQ